VFKAKKLGKKVKNSSKYYELDLLNRRINIYNKKFKMKKRRDGNQLLLVEPDLNEPSKLTLSFMDAPHVQILVFKRPIDRHLFYECAMAMRQMSLCWVRNSFNLLTTQCPHLCPDNLDRCRAIVDAELGISVPPLEQRIPVFRRRSIIPSSTALTAGMENTVAISPSLAANDNSDSDTPTENEEDDNNFHVTTLEDIKRPFDGRLRLDVTRDAFEKIQVYCGTWNMGTASPPNSEIFAEFVPIDMDIYAITLQEASHDNIDRYITRHIGPQYVQLCQLALWDIHLMVYVRDSHISKITCLSVGSKATGFLNVCGNKGGLGISFKFNETSLCFIGCHLAANEEKISQRNTNVQEICDSVRLGVRDLDLTQFHHLFWCGDLNYRVNMPFETSVSTIEAATTGVSVIISSILIFIACCACTIRPTDKTNPIRSNFAWI
jgi:hypothetical protein